mgnify:CR=1 FL=1
MNKTRRVFQASVGLGVTALICGIVGSCQDAVEPTATAKRITSRSELIGGPGALGEVKDFLLENEKHRKYVKILNVLKRHL